MADFLQNLRHLLRAPNAGPAIADSALLALMRRRSQLLEAGLGSEFQEVLLQAAARCSDPKLLADHVLVSSDAALFNLGKGCGGSVKAIAGTGFAVKLSHLPDGDGELYQEQLVLQDARKACQGLRLTAPECYGFSSSVQAVLNSLKKPQLESDTCCLLMEALEIPWGMELMLRQKIDSDEFWSGRECLREYTGLWRLYLGQESGMGTTGSFVDAPTAAWLGIPVTEVCASMATFLSRMAFLYGHDCTDSEFVLYGGTEVKVAVVDFGQSRKVSVDDPSFVPRLVKSMKRNDPYLPCPSSDLWDVFVRAYVQEAATLGYAHLATQVTEQLASF